MSRIGNNPIPIPNKVKVKVEGTLVSVQGPKGELERNFNDSMSIEQEEGSVKISRSSDERRDREIHGLSRSLLMNMIAGVSDGFSKSLELVGVGYRVQQSGKGITLSVMFSHPVDIEASEGIELEVVGNNRINVNGIDKQQVGQIAAEIRKVRPPNVYTGKGIRYLGEEVHLKPGKSARKAEV
jgi:large subunit ribosomal protein L6